MHKLQDSHLLPVEQGQLPTQPAQRQPEQKTQQQLDHIEQHKYQPYDIFISYGREDSKAFAMRLCGQLRQQGFQIWFDQNNIPLGVDFQRQIDDGLEKSHNFLFVISPHSINSIYCAKEIDLAVKLNKRIIPVLHIEEIDYAQWQQRYPGGSADEWQAYRAAGKHSSFMHMHPDISKINWVYARAQDDFAAATNGLVELLHRQAGYVHQHTQLLDKALTWDRHQRQAKYLLMGEARRKAQTWQLQRFENAQRPCLPTPLHDEFITESIKAADGGMTQVFISYVQDDRSVKDEVYHHLLQAGLTVWTDTTDIQSGQDFEVAIQRGIEQSDSMVYLISAASIKSDYCQQEIETALTLNKRILPMLIEDIDLSLLTDTLRKIQFINLADNQVALDLAQDFAKLLGALRREAPYYDQHKRLLVKALKWQRQKDNPSLLLRRKPLEKYAAWAQVARHRQQHGALPVQLAFLEASSQQPIAQTLGVFINHHADDIDFSKRLNETLIVQGKSTWFTAEGAAGDSQTQAETHQAIDNAENFLFVLSLESMQDKHCLEHFAYAQYQQKRIVLVTYQKIFKSLLADDFASYPLSDFSRQEGDFLMNFGELFRTLESDPEHVRSHTRLLVKATEWKAASYDDSFLLRGKDLAASVQWLAQSANNRAPRPTECQQAYIAASQALPFRKIKGRTVAIATTLTTLLVSTLRLFGGLQPLEVQAYDQLMRLRPSEETQDERLLIVKVDSESGEWLREEIVSDRYAPGIGTIPEKALDEAVSTLNRHGAQLIGLDFFRDFPAEGALKATLATTDNLMGICQSASWQVADIPNQGIAEGQVGFANLLLDGRKTVRRQYLNQWIGEGESSCTSYESFSLLLAKKYLDNQKIDSQKIAYQDPYADAITVPMRMGECRGA